MKISANNSCQSWLYGYVWMKIYSKMCYPHTQLWAIIIRNISTGNVHIILKKAQSMIQMQDYYHKWSQESNPTQ